MSSCDFLKIYQWVRRTTLRGLEAATVCYILVTEILFLSEKSQGIFAH